MVRAPIQQVATSHAHAKHWKEKMMRIGLRKFGALAAVAAVALLSSSACSQHGDRESSSSVLGPSTLEAKGGGKPPGGGGGTSSLTLKMVTDGNGNGLPNWGDEVTFTISTSATTEPFVDLACYQNGTLVYGTTGGFFASYPWPWTKVMLLKSPSWQGGAAQCQAKLYYLSGRNNVVLATASFSALE
jgi:hypothetical protein